MPEPTPLVNRPLAPKSILTPWKEFLEECPPGEKRGVTGTRTIFGGNSRLSKPDITLFCDSEACNRKQFFTCQNGELHHSIGDYVLLYQCRNCTTTEKRIAVRLTAASSDSATVLKYGEIPQFGPPVPAKLQRLIQDDRELFLKGYRCENRGLGIGAFAYYRRVVENEKTRLIDEIIKVCGKVTMGGSFIPTLEKARANIQFSKAVKEIAEAIPDALRINGHNPLTLLHSALSKGIHNNSDEECLGAAHAIRIVLTDLAERMSEILKENNELHQAISKLLAPQKAQPPETP